MGKNKKKQKKKLDETDENYKDRCPSCARSELVTVIILNRKLKRCKICEYRSPAEKVKN